MIMAARKEKPKPLFDIKADFYSSLDNASQQALNLMQAVDQAIQLGAVKQGPVADLLTTRANAMRAALMGDDDAES